MMTAPLHELTHDVVTRLVDVCQEAESRYALAARGMTDPMLRAEFAQYSVQRREFIAELVEAIHEAGDDLREAAKPAEDTPTEAMRRAVAEYDHVAVLVECERSEALTVEAYRQAVAVGLPYVVGGVVYSQFLAVSRVHDRIQLLASTALDIQN